MTKTKNAPKVAILVGTSFQWGRMIVEGINQYAREHGPWRIFIEAQGIDEIDELPATWQGDGVIARISNVKLARQLDALDIPVVNTTSIRLPDFEHFPRVTSNNHSFVSVALGHFQNLGFNHVGYFGYREIDYIRDIRDIFIQAVKDANLECSVYEVPFSSKDKPAWNSDITALQKWIHSLPKPIGILAWNPVCGRQLVLACEQEGVFVPDDVAVLCAGDDDLLCEISDIPLSAVDLQPRQIGYEAARMLDRLMHNKTVPEDPVLVKPHGVTVRQSTNTLAIKDPQLIAAIRFIQEHADEGIHVTDVARNAGMSRRVLERRFSQLLGRTPSQEIRRVKLDHAKQLLIKTEMSISDIAESVGFGSPEYMSTMFKHHEHLTPQAFRGKYHTP